MHPGAPQAMQPMQVAAPDAMYAQPVQYAAPADQMALGQVQYVDHAAMGQMQYAPQIAMQEPMQPTYTHMTAQMPMPAAPVQYAAPMEQPVQFAQYVTGEQPTIQQMPPQMTVATEMQPYMQQPGAVVQGVPMPAQPVGAVMQGTPMPAQPVQIGPENTISVRHLPLQRLPGPAGMANEVRGAPVKTGIIGNTRQLPFDLPPLPEPVIPQMPQASAPVTTYATPAQLAVTANTAAPAPMVTYAGGAQMMQPMMMQQDPGVQMMQQAPPMMTQPAMQTNEIGVAPPTMIGGAQIVQQAPAPTSYAIAGAVPQTTVGGAAPPTQYAPAPSSYTPPAVAYNTGMAPPTVMGGAAPATMIGGAAPPTMVGGAAPPTVMGGAAPPTIVGGAAPPTIMGGAAPPTVVGGAPAGYPAPSTAFAVPSTVYG